MQYFFVFSNAKISHSMTFLFIQQKKFGINLNREKKTYFAKNWTIFAIKLTKFTNKIRYNQYTNQYMKLKYNIKIMRFQLIWHSTQLF